MADFRSGQKINKSELEICCYTRYKEEKRLAEQSKELKSQLKEPPIDLKWDNLNINKKGN